MMKNSFRWQLYITAHNVLFGVPFLFFPNTVLPIIGYEPTNEPWIRVAGILFLVIARMSYGVYEHHLKELLLPSIQLRLAISCFLLYFAFESSSIFFYSLTVIIFIGVVGSSLSYYTETTIKE